MWAGGGGWWRRCLRTVQGVECEMNWYVSHRFDVRALRIANRHYNRQKVESPQFVKPGRCLVLVTANADAFWVSSWQDYVDHEWKGAWECSAFRNEGPVLSSLLIREAVAATKWKWRDVPTLGMITFVNRDKVKPKQWYGECYRWAGFEVCGETKSGLLALRLPPDDMPGAKAPLGTQMELLA